MKHEYTIAFEYGAWIVRHAQWTDTQIRESAFHETIGSGIASFEDAARYAAAHAAAFGFSGLTLGAMSTG